MTTSTAVRAPSFKVIKAVQETEKTRVVYLYAVTEDAIKETPGDPESRWFRPTRAEVILTAKGTALGVNLTGPQRLPASHGKPARDRRGGSRCYRIYTREDLRSNAGKMRIVTEAIRAAKSL